MGRSLHAGGHLERHVRPRGDVAGLYPRRIVPLQTGASEAGLNGVQVPHADSGCWSVWPAPALGCEGESGDIPGVGPFEGCKFLPRRGRDELDDAAGCASARIEPSPRNAATPWQYVYLLSFRG